jgi:hypothetical protein
VSVRREELLGVSNLVGEVVVVGIVGVASSAAAVIRPRCLPSFADELKAVHIFLKTYHLPTTGIL